MATTSIRCEEHLSTWDLEEEVYMDVPLGILHGSCLLYYSLPEGYSGKEVLLSTHDHMRVQSYKDADWDGSIIDRRSTSGYLTLVGGNLVTTKLQ